MDITAIDNKVKQVVSNIRNLPTPPIVFHQIQKVMNDSSASANHVANILSEDPAMSVKVLKLTNSAFYGLTREVDSVRHAVVIVGMEAVKNLVLSASVLDMFKGNNINQEFHEKHWRHSLATGFCCRILSRRLKAKGIVSPDSAFSAGLLHDIGKMVLRIFLPNETKQLDETRTTDKESQDFQLEENVLGYNHAQVGGILATHWKLPGRLGEAITYHHHPQLCESEEPIAYMIHIGDYIAKYTFYDDDDAYLVGELDPQIREYMGINTEEIDKYSEELRGEYLKAETFMQMAGIG